MKVPFIFIAVFGVAVSAIPVNASSSSCSNFAITASERKAIEIVEDMYYVQSEIKVTGETLNKLNQQRSKGYDQYSSNSVAGYNNLINKYNNVVVHGNKLSEQYNQLRNSYNSLINQISPSTNIAFTTCLNSQILSLETNTTSFNIDSLNLTTDNLRINTENLHKNINTIKH